MNNAGRRTVPPAQTWWNNEHADSGAHALLVAGSVCGVPMASGSDSQPWRAVPHTAYSNDLMHDMNQNFRFSEPDVVFDARLAGPFLNWTALGFDDSHWPHTVDRGAPGSAPWGALVARPIPFFRRSAWRQYTALRVEADKDDGDGFHSLGRGDVGGSNIASPLPPGCCGTPAACKAACLAVPACKAVVWTADSKGCNLKAATAAKVLPVSRHTVFIRSYRRLIGTLPYDAQVTPTLQVPPLPASAAGESDNPNYARARARTHTHMWVTHCAPFATDPLLLLLLHVLLGGHALRALAPALPYSWS